MRVCLQYFMVINSSYNINNLYYRKDLNTNQSQPSINKLVCVVYSFIVFNVGAALRQSKIIHLLNYVYLCECIVSDTQIMVSVLYTF